MKRSFVFLFVAVSITAILGSGCSFKHTWKPRPSFEDSLVLEREPISVGIYYGPDFRTYEYRRASGTDWYISPIGQPSVDMFDKIFSMTFESVVPVADLPPIADERNDIVAVIEPRIEAFHFRLGYEKETERHSITYRFTMYTMDGVPLSSWIVRGKSQPKFHMHIKKEIDDDMQDAAIKFLGGFRESIGADNLALLNKSRNQEYRASFPPLDESAVSASAETLMDPEKLKYEFGVPLNEVGIIAVKVSVRNDGNQRLLVRGSDIHMVLHDGKRIAPASPSLLTPKMEEIQRRGMTIGVLINPFLGVALDIGEAREREKIAVALQQKFRASQLGEKVLEKNDVSEGFVYFIPPEGTPAFDDANLGVWFVDTDTARGLKVELPLENIGFKGASTRK